MAADQNQVPTFKVVLVGDGGVGKTTLVKSLLTGEFERRYIATLGVEVHTLDFSTTIGPVQLDIWDTAGQERFAGLQEGYWINADAAIIMFDCTSRMTYKNVPVWYRKFSEHHKANAGTPSDLPMLLVANKVDIEDRKVRADHITFHRSKHNMRYHEMSVKSRQNTREAFLWIIKQLLQRQDVQLLISPGTRDSLESHCSSSQGSENESEATPTSSVSTNITEAKITSDISDANNSTDGERSSASTPKASIPPPVALNETIDIESVIHPLGSINLADSVSSPLSFQLFVLCTYCTRMIYVKTGDKMIRKLVQHPSDCMLTVTECRSCKSHNIQDSPRRAPSISCTLMKQTRIYDCAAAIVGGEITLGTGEMVARVTCQGLLEHLTPSCEVRAVDTCSTTLKSLATRGKDQLILPFIPGAFF